LITGATYNKTAQEILLTGYSFSNTFLWRSSGVRSSHLSGAANEKFILNVSGSQIEGICKRNGPGYFLSSEAGQSTSASLLHVELPAVIASLDYSQAPSAFYVYPNPSHDFLYRREDEPMSIEIFNSNGKLVLSGTESILNIKELSPGLYTIILRSEDSFIQTEKLIIY